VATAQAGGQVRAGRHGVTNRAGVISIGSRVTVFGYFVFGDLDTQSPLKVKITIGDGSIIMFRFQCNAAESVRIGEDVSIASNVFITDSDHVVEPDGTPVTRNTKLVTRPVEIGNGCWIGQNAVILKGVTIGEHCVVGANSVVTRDVPARTVVAGNPAKVIKTL